MQIGGLKKTLAYLLKIEYSAENRINCVFEELVLILRPHSDASNLTFMVKVIKLNETFFTLWY